MCSSDLIYQLHIQNVNELQRPSHHVNVQQGAERAVKRVEGRSSRRVSFAAGGEEVNRGEGELRESLRFNLIHLS